MNRVEVTLQDIFWTLKKYIVWIILACILGSIGTYAYTKLFVTPVYSAKVSFVSFASVRDGVNVSNGELTADMNIAYTYAALMNSEPICIAVSEELGGSLTPDAISGMISASREYSTQVINVSLRSTNPQLTMAVGNALLKVAPAVLEEKAGGHLSPVDSARVATLVSPNLTSNVVYGFLVSLVLACTVVVLIAVMDTTVWREEDLEKTYNIPVLGSVPSMTLAESLAEKQKKGR